MSFMTVEVEQVSAPTPGQRKPKLAIHGIRRRTIQTALKTLKTIQRQDEREGRRSEARQYTPLLVQNERNSADDKAIKRLIDRLQLCIDARL